MRKNKHWSISSLVFLIIILWIVFGTVPFFRPNVSDSIVHLLTVSFTAATALFTGIAFVVAYYNLHKQQENIREQQKRLDKQQVTLIKQIDLNVFSDSMRLVMDSDKYNQCREYIYSNNFTDDIAAIRAILYLEATQPVCLDDFRRANQSLSRTENTNEKDKNMKKRLSDSYEKIRFFCMRMEFLGVVVSRENAAEALIIDYYGQTIIDTYGRLESLIETTRKNKDSASLYMYYTELYNKVMQKRETN